MYEYKAEVLRVVDADTFDLLVDVGFSITLKERFRLNGVDAPESWRPKTKAEGEHGN
jgi:micrococcal nuclease